MEPRQSVSEMIDLERQDEDFDLLEAIQIRSKQEGWSQILQEALDILSDKTKQNDWQSAANIIFWSSPDKTEMPIPKMAVVARLTWCQINGDGLDDSENLVWTIAKDLKGVAYLSDWDPQKDPEVRAYLDSFG